MSVKDVLMLHIGSPGDNKEQPTVFGKIAGMMQTLSGMPTGTVKSVQRGEKAYENGKKEYEIDISEVKPEKCLVILNVGPSSTAQSASDSAVCLRELKATMLVISAYIGINQVIGWQVIEFY